MEITDLKSKCADDGELVKHVPSDTDSKIVAMWDTNTKNVVKKIDESEKELYERSGGIIHKEARLWFVPVILLSAILVCVVCWGIAGRSSTHDDLFDKIASSQDKFETVKTLRQAEQHEIYYSFFLIIIGLILVGSVVAGLVASRAYTMSDTRLVSASGREAANLSMNQMVQIRQDQNAKRELKEDVKLKEKQVTAAEEKTRETQQKLSVTEKELEVSKRHFEEVERMHIHREKDLQGQVGQLTSDKKKLEDDVCYERNLKAKREAELKSQREVSRIEQDNLRQRLWTSERDKQDALKEAAYEKGHRDGTCLCM